MRILQILCNYSTYREIPTVALLPRNDMVVGAGGVDFTPHSTKLGGGVMTPPYKRIV